MKSKILSGIVVSAILTIASGAAFPARAAFSHKVAKVVVGYDANRSTLANFPVLVRVPTATASECRADGADMRFTSADGEMVWCIPMKSTPGTPLENRRCGCFCLR